MTTAVDQSPLGPGPTKWLMDADDLNFVRIIRVQKATNIAAFIKYATRQPELRELLRRVITFYRLQYVVDHITRLELENACRAAGLSPIAIGPERALIRGWRSEPFGYKKAA